MQSTFPTTTTRCLTLALLIVVVSCKTTAPPVDNTPAAPEVPTLVKIGETSFSPDEFFQSFTKNRLSADSAQGLDAAQYFEVFTNTKLKLLAARRQGRDTTSDYQEEIATYRDQLAAPYLTDKESIDELTQEAYNRLKQEVHAAHILVGVSPEAAPADTLSAYRAAVAMRGRLAEGANFGTMAEKFSKDPSAPENQGDLGYFSAFQMVYPFETAAYLTPVGQVSEPVRTQFGYELIKVLDRRPSRGKRRVAHVMVQLQPSFSADKRAAARRRIDQAYARLQKGEAWETIVQAFSDDFQSRQKGGVIPPFGVGEAVPAFEDAAFGLMEVGAYSKPIETPYGWHIVRLVEKLPLESFAAMEPGLRQKVVTDSRGKLIEQRFANKLKKEYTIRENPDAWSELLELADSTLVAGLWVLPETFSADVENPVLFTIEKESATAKMFLEYTKTHLVPRREGANPKIVLRSYYNDFLNRRLLAYERNNLGTKYPEYSQLMKDIKEGVLLSQVMEEQVWQRSLDDSTGQRQLYEQNKAQYRYPERALATIVEARDTATLNRVREALAGELYPLRSMGQELVFENGLTQPSMIQIGNLYNLAATLKKNPDYVVEIAGFRTADEADTVSSARIGQAVRYLNAQGIPITRIMEKDYGSFRPVPVATTGADRNRRVSFQFFSRSRRDLEKALNRDEPGSVKISEGLFARDHPYFKSAQWQPGRQTITMPDGKAVELMVKEIQPARIKTFDEARGTVINAYQKVLEKNWLDSLKDEFPVKINQAELEKMTR